MSCLRCSGFMVEEHFLDFEGTYGQMWATGWRCMNCGHIHDSVIEQNQQARQKQVLSFSTGEPDRDDHEVHLMEQSTLKHAA